MGNVTGFLEPLQPELHLQGQWSLCMVGYEIFLLEKGSSKPQKSSNQSSYKPKSWSRCPFVQ